MTSIETELANWNYWYASKTHMGCHLQKQKWDKKIWNFDILKFYQEIFIIIYVNFLKNENFLHSRILFIAYNEQNATTNG
jgi:hypothetical protein